jgi:hypothetical protein
MVELGRRIALQRWTRSVLVPLVIALPPLFWVVLATRRAALVPFGRDQGIFQYVAWAIRRGDRDYRDVRDVNGPLTHLIHVFFQWLGGADEHRFRVLDLLVSGAVFALAGACLPGSLGRARPVLVVERIAWALAGWAVLSAQYLAFLYWDLAQRESFFNWFMLASVALQLQTGPARKRLLPLVGALSFITWFGKPTYALFTLFQLLALERADLKRFGIGAAIGAVIPLGFLVFFGDVGAYLKIQLSDVPAMYRFIWPRSAGDIFSIPWYATQAIFGVAGTSVMLALIVRGQMPRRALAVALLPLGGIVNVIVQAKGFPYHFHTLTAATHLQWLVLGAWLYEKMGPRLVPLVGAAVLALRVATDLEESPHIKAVWLEWRAATPEKRQTREYFASFPESDFFPFEMREAARYVRDHTQPGDRVQTYGMDAYVLYLADRLSATPYIYAYDLNVDSALAGGTGAVPNEEQAAPIRAIQKRHEDDLFARLQKSPPAAFVFLDKAPLMSVQDAWIDFATHCPRTGTWVGERYRETAAFGPIRVWLRNDLANAVDKP